MRSEEIWPPPPRFADDNADIICVPLNIAKFRAYRNMQRGTAVMGATMTVGVCAFPAMLLYVWIVDPKHPDPSFVVLGAILSVMLPFIVGVATWPAMQVAKILTQTLDKNLPGLVVDREGVQDNSSNYVFGFIRWNEIQSVTLASRYSRNLNKDFHGIAFVVKNEKSLLRRKSGALSSWMSMDPEITNRRQVFIPQGRIAVPVEEVVEQINNFRARMNV